MGDEWLGKEVTGEVVDWKQVAGSLVLIMEVEAGVMAELEVRCRAGHDLTQVENAAVSNDGYVRCKVCARLADALRRRQRRLNGGIHGRGAC